MTRVNRIARFRSLVKDEHIEPDLRSSLKCLSDVFRGEAAWHVVDAGISELVRDYSGSDLGTLVSDLFGSDRLTGEKDNYDDPRNSFLDHCLQTGRGLPITLCLIASFVADARGIECALVGLPGHVVLSDGAPSGEPRIYDPFNGGKQLSLRECRSIAALSGVSDDRDMFSAMTPRAVLVRVLNNLVRSYERRRDLPNLWRCAGFRLSMPEIRRLDGPRTLALVRDLN